MHANPTTIIPDMRHGAEARLRFLDAKAFWDGRVNRADLMQRFGVSVPQATADLGRYQEIAPANLHYDRQARAYLASAAFQPVFGPPAAEGWLRRAATEGDARSVPAEDLPLPERALNPWLVRRVARAIRDARSLRVLYQTMEPSEPVPIWRWITPRAFAADGFRWHLRAFNHDTQRHEDLLFPRMFEVGEDRPATDLPLDRDWERLVTVRLRPSPGLSETQKRAVAADFLMEDGSVDLTVRAAMLQSFLRRMRLDRGHRLIEIANTEEVDAALRDSRAIYGITEDPADPEPRRRP